MSVPSATLCRSVLAENSKSFALAGWLLPRELGDEAAALYAWCRRADDVIDLGPSDSRLQALATLRLELASIYREEPQHDPMLAAFQAVVRRRAIPKEYPEALLEGLGMDTQGVQYDSVRTLLLYCFKVAGVVGLMMCHVLGVSHVAALRHAAHLGIAMQLTNVCRDVEEDYRRGRLYLPRSLLGSSWIGLDASLGVASPAALLAAREPIRRAVADLRALSEAFYRSGERGLRYLPWRAAIAVHTASLVYSAIGRRLAGRNHDVLAGRTVVPALFKVALACVALCWALMALPRALVRRFRRVELRDARCPNDVVPV